MSKTYNFSRMQLLLVDNSPFMRGTVRQMCRSFGFLEILEASNGQEALNHLNNSAIDIVLCDWMTDPLDGFELTRLLRSSPTSPNPFVPIIILTSRSEMTTVTKARDIGVTEFLAKPISAETLLGRLIHVCEKPRSFVRCPGFFGPDRRRRTDDGAQQAGERRGRGNQTRSHQAPESGEAVGWGLSDDDVNRILSD